MLATFCSKRSFNLFKNFPVFFNAKPLTSARVPKPAINAPIAIDFDNFLVLPSSPPSLTLSISCRDVK